MNRYLPIGIDIGRHRLSAIQIIAKGRRLKLTAPTCQPIQKRLDGSTEDGAALQSAVQSLTHQRVFKGKRAVISLPQAYLFAFPVTIEMERHQHFETALSRACSKHLNFPIEEAVIDYFCLQNSSSATNRKHRVAVVAAHSKLIHRLMAIFKKAGLRIGTIDYGLCALIRLHTHIHALSRAPSMLVHMDSESTLMAVATHDDIIAHRHLDWGVERLQQSLTQSLQIIEDPQQALSMLHTYGVAYDALQTKPKQRDPSHSNQDIEEIAAMRVASQILMPHIDELVHELYQMVGYARSILPDLKFQELWLYGEATKINHLGPFLEKQLKIPTQCMDLSAKLALGNDNALDTAGLDPYINALGLAMREAS